GRTPCPGGSGCRASSEVRRKIQIPCWFHDGGPEVARRLESQVSGHQLAPTTASLRCNPSSGNGPPLS
uniref:Uncharacterized protein n=1 Tax=Aegilops tauschii subsp. strangulata TaxID=200361 RepID=A0A453A8P9_AEGTS